MKTVAIIEKGLVINIVMTNDSADPSVALAKGQSAVPLPEQNNVAVGDSYARGNFISADRSAVPVDMDPEEIQARNRITHNALLTIAGLAIEPLNDAEMLGAATDEEKQLLLAWRQYRIALNRLDLNVATVTWPPRPDSH